MAQTPMIKVPKGSGGRGMWAARAVVLALGLGAAGFVHVSFGHAAVSLDRAPSLTASAAPAGEKAQAQTAPASSRAQIEAKSAPLIVGQEGRGPWWMRQTPLEPGGRFTSLKTRRWWKKAAALKTGESLVIEGGGETKDRMLLRRENVSLGGRDVDTLVWIIDDDGDGSVASGGDKDSDCYVIDYGVDGLVDRMVDYIDDNADGVAEEADIRFFNDGVLDYAWFGALQGGGVLWNLRDFGDSLEGLRACDPSGQKLFYVNKFDAWRGRWVPLGVCPLALRAADKDGAGRASVVLGVVPADWNPGRDPDFASAGLSAPWRDEMRKASIAGLCASFAAEAAGNGTAAGEKLGLSLNLSGGLPYDFPGMTRFNAQRRPPQETVVVPWERAASLVDSYEASQTGFSWVETGESLEPGESAEGPAGGPNATGVAWIRERRFMTNSGGPAQKWNVRREWSGKASSKREFYYSDVDKRIHLVGAEDGWIQIGHFAGLGVLGEIRMFDTDANGFFDRWELYLATGTRPVRVTQVEDEKARRLDAGPAGLAAVYAKDVLPKARAENERLLAAMNALRPFDPPPGLKNAAASGASGERLYAQDVQRELAYLNLRDYYSTLANQILMKDGRAPGEFTANSTALARSRAPVANAISAAGKAWRLARVLERLDIAYGEGDYAKAIDILGELGKVAAEL